MKNSFLRLLILFLILCSFTTSFCLDKSKSIANNISGRVINEKYFPVQFVKVIIGNSEIETDEFGKFKLANVSFPYDAIIAKRPTATAVIYKNLSIENPDLILFGEGSHSSGNSAVINVNFPEVPDGSSAIIKFISQDVFYCEDVTALARETSKTLLVNWPLSQKNINGNIIYLQRNTTSYEDYRNKPLTVFMNYVPFDITFSSSSNNNPPTSDLTIYLPFDDYRVKGYSIFADFFAFNRNSEILLTKEEGNIFRTKSIIPSILPISFRLKVSGFVDYKDGSGFVNYTYSSPGSVINLTTEKPPTLQTPSDKYMGASGNTEFSYTLGSGTGIFVIQFHSFYPNMDFYIVTGERSAYLTYLSRDEFKFSKSVEFKWNVKKHLTYFSVNDFVKPKEFKNDIGYKAILYSSERTFKTGYF